MFFEFFFWYWLITGILLYIGSIVEVWRASVLWGGGAFQFLLAVPHSLSHGWYAVPIASISWLYEKFIYWKTRYQWG